jgi:hypothetical protein
VVNALKLQHQIVLWVLVALLFMGAILLPTFGVIPNLWQLVTRKDNVNNIQAEKKLTSFLENLTPKEFEQLSANIDDKNVAAVLNSLKRFPSFEWQTVLEYTDIDSKEVGTSTFRALESRTDTTPETVTTKVEKLSKTSKVEKTMIAQNGEYRIHDYLKNTDYKGKMQNNYTIEQDIGIPLYTDFLSVPKENVRTLSLDKLVISESDEYDVVYLEFENTTLGILDKYWVSLDFGLVLKAESYKGDNKYYSANTVMITDAVWTEQDFRQ